MTSKILVNGREVGPPSGDGWSAVQVQPNVWSVLANGKSVDVFCAPDGAIVVDGERLEVEVIDPRALRRRTPGASLEGRQTLKAAMPGKVVRVLLAEGEAVELGQGVVVVEAMKMQNEVKSPKDGIVVKVAVAEGATVNAGQVLAIVE